MLSSYLPHVALEQDATPITDRLPSSLVLAWTPVGLSIAIGIVYGEVTGTVEPGVAATNVIYGVSSLFVVGLAGYLLTARERTAAFPIRRPGRDELAWTALGFPVGTAVFLAGRELARAAGFTLGGYEYTLSDPVTVGAVIFGAVLVAPLAEELLFRGFLLGSLLGRGLSPVVAGLTSVVAFGLLHLPLLGVGGVIATGTWALVPTALRLRFNNLSGAWLLHTINNVWSYLGIVALGIA